jgi:tetratricopeptide (TPR) repeat protein
LKELGLDWDWPELPPVDPGRKAAEPPQMEVLLGDQARPVLTPEQKARQAIDRDRRAIEANPNDAAACNNLAWVYVTGPEALRDVKAALPLAEKAVRLAPDNAVFRNTLGVAYYRAGRHREAAEVLRPNLDSRENWALAFDLYFLAMSHHHLGETVRARDYYDWAVRWPRTHPKLTAGHLEELDVFRTEAAKLLGIDRKKN